MGWQRSPPYRPYPRRRILMRFAKGDHLVSSRFSCTRGRCASLLRQHCLQFDDRRILRNDESESEKVNRLELKDFAAYPVSVT